MWDILLNEVNIKLNAKMIRYIARLRPNKATRTPLHSYASIIEDIIHNDPMIFYVFPNKHLGRGGRTAQRIIQSFFNAIGQARDDDDARAIEVDSVTIPRVPVETIEAIIGLMERGGLIVQIDQCVFKEAFGNLWVGEN